MAAMGMARALALGTWMAVACKGGDDPDGYTPDRACPGDPSGVCDLVENARLLAGAAVVSIVGLGNDELGYIIPAYDFELHTGVPYVIPAEGHYEETNSLGPDMADRIEDVATALLQWAP